MVKGHLKKDNKLPIELQEQFTNELIVLGLLYYADKHEFDLGRMKLVKLIWKFKELIQKKLALQAYYSEAYKGQHGKFNKEFYDQLNDLKKAGFINASDIDPRGKISINKKGRTVFRNFDSEDSENSYSLNLVKNNLEYIIKNHGHKSASQLREEDHEGIDDCNNLPLVDEECVLLKNLKKKDIKHQFLFDKKATLDWVVAISLGKRKADELVVEPEELPSTQEDAYKMIGLAT